MLEEIKEVLISELQHQLEYKKQIDKNIKKLTKEYDQKQKQTNEELSNLEFKLKSLNNNLFSRIIHEKEIRKIYTDYITISNSVVKELKELNDKIESLYQQIYDISHDEALIEKEIQTIKQASSIQELGLTEREALKYIKNDERKVIRAVFKNILSTGQLQNKIDIDRTLNELYQTNLSPFVVAMQKINVNDLIQELIYIGIELDQDKIDFLNDLLAYIEDSNNKKIIIKYNQEEIDDLDNEFYKQIKQELTNMKKHSYYPPIAISKIITLAVLVSITKTNKKLEKKEIKI